MSGYNEGRMVAVNKQFLSLDKRFQPTVFKILSGLEKFGWQPIVGEGLRTEAEQKQKVAAGDSQTMNSYHLTGLAADIVDKRYMWDLPVVHKLWLDLANVALSLTPISGLGFLRLGLVWGNGGGLLDPVAKTRMTEYVEALKQGKKTVPWFCDYDHVELHII